VFRGDANVVVCRTFSKVFGLAGARVGWATGTPGTLDPVRRIGLTFPVSTPALHAARAALQDRAHEEWVVAETRRLRAWLTQALTRIGLEPVPSQANFVLVRFPDPGHSAADATQALAAQGILIRRFASPIFEDFARITIGHAGDLQRAVTALEAFLGKAAAA
jgi:histidinol-phosphate aminotransferase